MSSLNKRAFGGLLILFLVMAFLLFAAAGTFAYRQGWTFLAVYFAFSLALTLYLMKKDPALLARGLPRWRSVAVLAADAAPPSAQAALQVTYVAAQLGAVVLDSPRSPGPVRDAALSRCTLRVVVAVAQIGR